MSVSPSQPCSQCGGPVTSPNSRNLCLECRIAAVDPAEARRMRSQREEAEARRALMAELGMPPDAIWKEITLPGASSGEEWQAYQVSMFGMSAGFSEWPPPWPFWRLFQTGGQGPGIVAQLWLRRVHCLDTPAFIEARWHPERGDTVVLRGLEAVTRFGDAQRALRGLRLLRLLDERGRPKGSRSVPKAEFRAKLPTFYFAYVDQHGEPPSQEWLADQFGVELRTLARYLDEDRRDGIPYPPRR